MHQELIERAAVGDVDSNTMMTALKVALANGNVDVVKELLQHGANSEGVLYSALINNEVSIVRTLFEAGVDFDRGWIVNYGESHCNANMMRLILQQSVYINHLDFDFATALIHAALHGKTEVFGLLIDAGADIDHWSVYGSALTCAIRRNDISMMEILLQRGAKVRMFDIKAGRFRTCEGLRCILASEQGRLMRKEDVFVTVLETSQKMYVLEKVKVILQSDPAFAKRSLLVYVHIKK